MNKSNDKRGFGKHQFMLNLITRFCRDIVGARVLDLGTDGQGQMVSDLRDYLKVGEAIGINPAIQNPQHGDGWRIGSGDARKLQFDDNYFDLVISVAAFEHFHGLQESLQQAYRVLRPGGFLISNFGPIWSGCWGHHLWLRHNDVLYTYQNTRLPPFGHLLMTQDEMRKWWIDCYSDPTLAEKAVHFICESEDQNRLFYDDYAQIFQESSFSIKKFMGLTNERKRAGYSETERGHALNALKTRLPKQSGFEFDSITVVLEKD